MPENLYLEFDAFLRSIKQNLDGSFGVLLGAGASISSGCLLYTSPSPRD